jgi:hypothetical protein
MDINQRACPNLCVLLEFNLLHLSTTTCHLILVSDQQQLLETQILTKFEQVIDTLGSSFWYNHLQLH